MIKTIAKVLEAKPMAEGVGAMVRRSIGSRDLRSLSPFLLLDYMEISKPDASFPDHPHRGLETVTHEGTIEHEDFTGSHGTLYPGDLQVMTAGKGIMHAEIPRPGEGDEGSHGLQLWVDLPKYWKDMEPSYRDIRKDSVAESEPYPGVKLRTISNGVSSSITRTPIFYWDYFVAPTRSPVSISTPHIPKKWNSFLYVTQGKLQVASTTDDCLQDTSAHDLVVFDASEDSDDVIHVQSLGSQDPVRFTVCAGQPLEQEVHRDMFFVQTSKEDLKKSRNDFKEKKNGFEKAKDWKSKIAGDIDFKIHM